MKTISLKSLSLIALLGAIVLSCKTAAIATVATPANSFHYAPLGWNFIIPEGWNIMAQETLNKVNQEGKKAISKNKSSNLKSQSTSNKLLSLEQKGSLFLAVEWPDQNNGNKAMPYNLSRLERFNFLYQTINRRSSYETEYQTQGVQLGQLYFEMVTLIAKPKSSFGVTVYQTSLETLHNGNVIMIQLTSTKEQVYQETLKSVLASIFNLLPSHSLKTWQDKGLLNTKFKVPKTLKESPNSSDSLAIFKNSKKKKFVTVTVSPKRQEPTLENRKIMDLAHFSAELDFTVLGLNRGSKEKKEVKEEFVGGKRCFTANFEYQHETTKMNTYFAYVIGKASDFQIYFDTPVNSKDQSQTLNNIIITLSEIESSSSDQE